MFRCRFRTHQFSILILVLNVKDHAPQVPGNNLIDFNFYDTVHKLRIRKIDIFKPNAVWTGHSKSSW